MKPGELREKSDTELLKLSNELEEEVFKLRFRLGSGQLKENTNIGKTRHDLARVKTILRERLLAKEREAR